MVTEARPSADETQRFYEDFSLASGLRDWLVANPRHEQLKLHIDDVLRDRRGLTIVDVGCGGGVMTAHLCRYGDVVGLDFSNAAIRAARTLAPSATFIAGTLDALPPGARFDVITLFDVLEHIPHQDRPEFLRSLRDRLADDGTVFISTPYPAYTRHRRCRGDETLQIVDEEVQLPRLAEEAAQVGLQLIGFQAFDVFRGSPEYQVMVFTTERDPGGPAVLQSQDFRRRVKALGSPRGRRIRNIRLALRLLAAGHRREARWILTGVPPHVRS